MLVPGDPQTQHCPGQLGFWAACHVPIAGFPTTLASTVTLQSHTSHLSVGSPHTSNVPIFVHFRAWAPREGRSAQVGAHWAPCPPWPLILPLQYMGGSSWNHAGLAHLALLGGGRVRTWPDTGPSLFLWTVFQWTVECRLGHMCPCKPHTSGTTAPQVESESRNLLKPSTTMDPTAPVSNLKL